MSLSRRNFLWRSAAGVVTAPFLQQLSVDLCDASPVEVVDFSMGYSPNAVRLNRNENPFGPSPKALEAIQRGLKESNRYVVSDPLRKAIADMLGMEEEWVLLGAGSSELLKLVPLVYLRGGGNLVSTSETFRVTPAYAKLLGAQVQWVHLRSDWTYDIEGLLAAVDAQTKVLYLVNPNNPTGASLTYDQLAQIADRLPKNVLFFIDEAYYHFLPGGEKTGVDVIKSGHENVFVTRTFSKVYGLAGLRVGYGAGHPSVIKRIGPFGSGFVALNTAGFGGALAALDDQEHIDRFTGLARKAKAFYQTELSRMGLAYVSGVSPFILVEVGPGAGTVVDRMAKEDVHVRTGQTWGMPRYIRISFGLEDQNRAAIEALGRALA